MIRRLLGCWWRRVGPWVRMVWYGPDPEGWLDPPVGEWGRLR